MTSLYSRIASSRRRRPVASVRRKDRSAVRVLLVRVPALLHVLGEGPDGPRDVFPKVRVALHELRVLPGLEAEQVRDHQDLAVAVRAGPAADGWHGEVRRD